MTGDLKLPRRVRDRIDREYAQPLDIEALARAAHMSSGRFSAGAPPRGVRDCAVRDPAGNLLRIQQL